jgi:predicted Rossmann fold nucleotide-binding protein DprA/Smf involved in DNA uptake
MSSLSPFTQLVVLLTGRWAVNGSKPLNNSELGELRRALNGVPDGANALLNGEFDTSLLSIEPQRLSGLLNRGLGVFQSVDKWLAAGIWVVSWADSDYPSRFKQLKHRAPALLFGYGSPNAFSERALAIVGSRNASDARLNSAAEIGRACSDKQITVVSGGARGIDSYAMQAGIVEKGTVVGVLADSLLRESGKKPYRDAIREGRMCLMSEVHPEAKFDVGNAMARNRLAYACADAALVVECDPNRGGTWAGALEALKEGKTVYVLKGAKAERELVERGAIRIDMTFALQPDRLIRSERPSEEVPQTSQVILAIRRLLGNPLRPSEEIRQSLIENPEAFLSDLTQAALSDGIIDQHPLQATPNESPAPKAKKQRLQKPKVGSLFEVLDVDNKVEEVAGG